MHDLVKSASHALAAQDAERLESLAREAYVRAQSPAAVDLGALARMAMVLTAQVHAAERHLGISPQRSLTGRSSPWEL